MDESKRTKVLGGVLAGVLGFMIGKPMYMGPIEKAKTSLNSANSSLERAEEKDWQVDLAEQLIDDTKQISLPPSVNDAQRIYLTWVTNLAEQCRFAQLKVTPGRTESRSGKYNVVSVEVEGEASLDDLSRFLYLFEQAELKQRVSALDVESTGSQGTPRMEVTMTLQGLSVAGSPSRGDVFARTHLPEKLDAEATTVVVGESADFPEKFPFKVQVGREMIEVVGGSGNTWEIERGVEGTKAAAHEGNEYVQLFGVSPLQDGVNFDRYSAFLAESLFTKPKPEKVYRPTFTVSNKTIEPGKTLKMSIKPRDINVDVGKATIAMDGAIDGMTYDAETGEFEWVVPEDAQAEKHELTFLLTQQNNDELNMEKTMTVTVQLANAAPVLTVARSAAVILGRDFSLDLKAEDDGDLDDLSFSLDGAPEGLSIDGDALSWQPPKTFAPGEYEFTVKVADSGSPSKSASRTVVLNVQDDTAAVTRFTAAVELDGVPVAWFWNQIENKRPELKVGDRLVVADINARLTEISKRFLLLEDEAGVWKLRLGDTLRDRQLVEPAVKQPAEQPEDPAEGDPEAPQTPSDNITQAEPAEGQPEADDVTTGDVTTGEVSSGDASTAEAASEVQTTSAP